MRFIRIFTEFISAFACDHRPALAAYAAYKGYTLAGEGNAGVITLPAGAVIRADYDPQGRVSGLSSTLTALNSGLAAETKPEKKPWWKRGG